MLKKFKVGQRVRVIKKVQSWNSSHGVWCNCMDWSLGKVYTVLEVTNIDYLLDTAYDLNNYLVYNYFYPEESLEAEIEIGQQLLFPFMESI